MFQLNDKTKAVIAKKLGITVTEMMSLDMNTIESLIEIKISKSLKHKIDPNYYKNV